VLMDWNNGSKARSLVTKPNPSAACLQLFENPLIEVGFQDLSLLNEDPGASPADLTSRRLLSVEYSSQVCRCCLWSLLAIRDIFRRRNRLHCKLRSD